LIKHRRTHHHTINHAVPEVPGHRKTASLKNSISLAHILRQAVACHQAGDIVAAESGYRTILEANPKHPDALHLMGMIFSLKGDFDASVGLIRQAIQLFPNSESITTIWGMHWPG
jgi:Tfp pilus assembly protein PilF